MGVVINQHIRACNLNAQTGYPIIVLGSISLIIRHLHPFFCVMHEFSITESILSIALEQAQAAGANKVIKVNLCVGELTGIVDDCVQFYFDLLSKDTIAAEAKLFFERIPTRARCRNCDTTFTTEDFNWSCPDCLKQNVEIISGRECSVTSIEVD